jgi:hypothetical protein
MYNGLRRVVLWNVSTGPENRVVQIWHQGLHLCEKGQVPSTYLSCYSFEFTEAHKIGFITVIPLMMREAMSSRYHPCRTRPYTNNIREYLF